MQQENKPVIDLLPSTEKLKGSNWVNISFVSKEGLISGDLDLVKIYASYDTLDQAKKHAEYLKKLEPHINIYTGECGKWLPWNYYSKETEAVYDKKGNMAEKLMSAHIEEWAKNNKVPEERKTFKSDNLKHLMRLKKEKEERLKKEKEIQDLQSKLLAEEAKKKIEAEEKK